MFSMILFKSKQSVTQSNKSIGKMNLSSDEAVANNIIQMINKYIFNDK